MDNRKQWIDIFKGLAIMLVVLGHLQIGQGLYRFLFLFHMYAFFFIGGVTRRKSEKSLLSFLLDNLKRLYVSYVVYASLWVATELMIGMYQGTAGALTAAELGKNALNILLGGGVIDGTAQVGPAWFLCALLVVRVAYELLDRLNHQNRGILAIAALLFLLLAYALEGFAAVPLRLTAALSAFGFFWVGDQCKNILNTGIKTLRRGWGLALCSLLAALAFGVVAWMAALSDRALILGGNILPEPWFVAPVGGLAGCAGLVAASLLLEKIPVAGKVAAFFGGCSMVVMGLHSQMRMGLYLVLPRLGLSGWSLEAVVFALSLGLCAAAAVPMMRYLPILAGKKNNHGSK